MKPFYRYDIERNDFRPEVDLPHTVQGTRLRRLMAEAELAKLNREMERVARLHITSLELGRQIARYFQRRHGGNDE